MPTTTTGTVVVVLVLGPPVVTVEGAAVDVVATDAGESPPELQLAATSTLAAERHAFDALRCQFTMPVPAACAG
jgi:hypothetical protein